MQMYHDLIVYIYIYHKLVGKEVLVLHQNHATSWPKWYEAKPGVRPGQIFHQRCLIFFPNCQVRVSTEFNNTFRPNGRMETHVHTSFLVSTSSPASSIHSHSMASQLLPPAGPEHKGERTRRTRTPCQIKCRIEYQIECQIARCNVK